MPRDEMLQTSFETHGYDGVREGTQWWFEAWGSGSKDEWRTRSEWGKPPTPEELVRADYIVFGFRKRGHVSYRTRTGGMDLFR